MADEKQYSVTSAFNSYHKDGSGAQKYFTAGNAHEIGDWLSDDEIEYRLEQGTLKLIEEPIEVEPVFQRPAQEELVEEGTTAARRARTRRSRSAAPTTEE